MNKNYFLFALLLFVFARPAAAQISGPATGAVGTPVSFSVSTPGNSYNWSFGTAARNIDPSNYIPRATRLITLPSGAPNYTIMALDGTDWYSFTIYPSGIITQASYGSNPLGVPVLTNLGVTVPNDNGNTTRGLDVVYDADAKRWYGFAMTGWTTGLFKLDFGAGGLKNLNPVITRIPTEPVNIGFTNQIVVKKVKGEWVCFMGGSGTNQFTRFDLGPSLEALNASTPELKWHRLGRDVYNFCLYEEDGKWYAIGGELGNLYRFDLGADIRENAPKMTQLTFTGQSSIRSVTVNKGCDGQVYGYMMGAAPNLYKLDFKGSILNNPTSTALSVTGLNYSNDGMAGFCPFAYKDTLYVAGSTWGGGNSLLLMRLLPLTGSETHYYDASVSHTFSAPGTYTVNVMVDGASKSGPSAYCHEIVISNPAPAQPGAFTVSKAAVCQGETGVTYTVPAVSGATSYEWQYAGTGGSFTGTATTTGPSNTMNFTTAATSGNIRVRAVNSGGQSAWREMPVTVNTIPVITVTNTGAQSICTGDSLRLTVSGSSGVNYQWKQGAINVGTNSATYYAKAAGDYTVMVTYQTTNCSVTSTPATSLSLKALPVVSSTNTGSQSVCAGDSLLLTATASKGVSYQWKNGTVNVGSNATYYAKTSGSYTVTVTDPATNCSATSTPATTLAIDALPTVSVTNTGAHSICAGDSLQLTATSSGVNYQWKQGTANVGANNATYYATAAGSYTVTVTSTTTNCSATSAPATILTVTPLPVATLTVTPPAIVCEGDSVLLTAGSGTGYSYQWKNGSSDVGTGGATYRAGTSGDYRVVVTDGSGNCRDSTTPVTVMVHTRPAATLNPGDTAFCDGGKVTLSVSTMDTGLNYRWKNGTGTIPQASANFLEVGETGVYTVVVGRAQVTGCEDTTNEVRVTVHPLPAANITWDKLLLHATPGYAGYQWNTGGQGIPGETDSTFRPSSDGGYSVTITDSNGCEKTSPQFNIKVGVDAVALAKLVKIYPNPSNGVIHIISPQPVNVILGSMEGKLLMRRDNADMIDISPCADGIYLLQISDKDGVLIRNEKIIKKTF